jgi:phosphoribosyl-AMP cyclohydrolase
MTRAEREGGGADPDDGGDPDPAPDLDFESEGGLLPAVAQDADSGEVLMLAYVSPEALERTRETGIAHYYSRSREELWKKGATSGHVQRVREVRGACHTGFGSCFHRTADGEVVGERVFDPEEVYDGDG